MATPCAQASRFIDLIGAEATLRLIEEFGGTRLYVPKTAGGQVATCIGAKAAALLSGEFARTIIIVPLARFWRCQIYREHGLSYARIARKLGIREEAVWKMLNAAQMTMGSQSSDMEAAS